MLLKFKMTRFLFFVLFLSDTLFLTAQHSLLKYDYPVNSDNYDEINPVLSYDEDKIYFTRIGSPDFDPTLWIDSVNVYENADEEQYQKYLQKVFKQIAGKEITNPSTSSFNQDIWVIQLDSQKNIMDLSHPGYPLNNALPNSICARFDDHDRFVLINQFEKSGGLDKGFSVTQQKKDEYSFPESIHIESFLVKADRVNLTCSPDQKILILAFPGKEGHMDLYVSYRIYHMFYTEPVKIKTGVNTTYDEMTPFLSGDTKTLYFASNRPESAGGTDIFSVQRLDENFMEWGDLQIYFPPLNSTKDEMYPCLPKEEKTILFSSNREGSFDLFQTSLFREKNISIKAEIFIINGQNQKQMPGELYWGAAYEAGKNDENFFRCRDGKHILNITENKPLMIQAVNRNLKSQAVIIDPQEVILQQNGYIRINLVLETNAPAPINNRAQKLEVLPFEQLLEKADSQEIKKTSAVFKNIMFEKSTANILERSLPTILTLGKFLKTNKNIKIEITGHTDNIGDVGALKQLSLDRANVIKDVLVKQGVDASRIFTSGKGDTQPLQDNESEVSRKQNRRVEIRIVKD